MSRHPQKPEPFDLSFWLPKRVASRERDDHQNSIMEYREKKQTKKTVKRVTAKYLKILQQDWKEPYRPRGVSFFFSSGCRVWVCAHTRASERVVSALHEAKGARNKANKKTKRKNRGVWRRRRASSSRSSSCINKRKRKKRKPTTSFHCSTTSPTTPSARTTEGRLRNDRSSSV